MRTSEATLFVIGLTMAAMAIVSWILIPGFPLQSAILLICTGILVDLLSISLFVIRMLNSISDSQRSLLDLLTRPIVVRRIMEDSQPESVSAEEARWSMNTSPSTQHWK